MNTKTPNVTTKLDKVVIKLSKRPWYNVTITLIPFLQYNSITLSYYINSIVLLIFMIIFDMMQNLLVNSIHYLFNIHHIIIQCQTGWNYCFWMFIVICVCVSSSTINLFNIHRCDDILNTNIDADMLMIMNNDYLQNTKVYFFLHCCLTVDSVTVLYKLTLTPTSFTFDINSQFFYNLLFAMYIV